MLIDLLYVLYLHLHFHLLYYFLIHRYPKHYFPERYLLAHYQIQEITRDLHTHHLIEKHFEYLPLHHDHYIIYYRPNTKTCEDVNGGTNPPGLSLAHPTDGNGAGEWACQI